MVIYPVDSVSTFRTAGPDGLARSARGRNQTYLTFDMYISVA